METCWFCETRPADANAAATVVMRGKEIGTRKTGFKEYTTYYERRTIMVPRCAECEANHRKMSGWNLLIGLAFLAPIGIGFFITSWFAPLGTFLDTLIPCVGGIIGIGISVLLAVKLAQSTTGTKNERHKNEFPAVKELKEKGWTIEHWVSTDSQRSA